MRKKALLVGAVGPFEGPRVFLEDGEWLVEPPSLLGDDLVILVQDGQGIPLNRVVYFAGPTWVRIIIKEKLEEPLFLHARAA